jgi:Tfp pilus assembly protein PilV
MRARAGFTIVEVVVALVMFTVVLMSLAALSVAAARMAVLNADATRQQAYTLELANRYMTVPWSSLNGMPWCDTLGGTNDLYRRCVASSGGTSTDTITISVTALQRSQRTETTRLVRTRP